MMVYSRRFLIIVCILQFISTVEWLVFNFLGFMWTPILACFLHIIFTLVGFFGALQYRPKCAIVYLLWLFLWIGVNTFVICIYLEIGILTKDSQLLNFGLGNKSWWFDHGIGCVVNASSPLYSSSRSPISSSSLGDVTVSGCLLHYTLVEIVHAGVQILLAALGVLAAICLAYVLRHDEDSSQPVKSSELEFISMRHNNNKGTPMHGAAPGTPPTAAEFGTLVTQVDTLSPQHSRDASRESLQPIPPQRLSANRLLLEAHLRPEEAEAEAEEAEEVAALHHSSRARPRPPGSSSSRRHRRSHGPRTASSVPASSYMEADGSSIDRRSVFSRDSQRPREPLPWVVAAPLLSDLGSPPPDPQPPPYSSKPPSLLTSAPRHQQQQQHREPPSPAPYRPPRPSGAHSPYENWQPPGMGTYENAWSPVPPLQPMMTSPISAEEAASSHWLPPSSASSRGGVIFFRSDSVADNSVGGGGGGQTFGGSVVV